MDPMQTSVMQYNTCNSRSIVGMANCGHNTNSSQFNITLEPTPWMDTVHVALEWILNVLASVYNDYSYIDHAFI